MPPWAATFHPFTWMHLVSLVWTLGLLALACRAGRRWLARGRVDLEEKLGSTWAGFLVGVNLWSLVYWHIENFSLKESLPIQLCDLACLLAPLIFLTPWRWPRAVLFFWGIGLSTQAFFTPTVLEGPGDVRYYLFWLVHLGIVGTAVYDVVVRGFRPTLRDLLFAVAVTTVYALSMVAVNHFLDANYGFVGNQLRERPTLIDRLGPWPRRVFVLAGIVNGVYILMWAAANLVDRVLPRPRRAACEDEGVRG